MIIINNIFTFANKTMYCHYIGSFVSLLTYHLFYKNKLYFIAYFNTPNCYTSYWIGFSYGVWKIFI